MISILLSLPKSEPEPMPGGVFAAVSVDLAAFYMYHCHIIRFGRTDARISAVGVGNEPAAALFLTVYGKRATRGNAYTFFTGKGAAVFKDNAGICAVFDLNTVFDRYIAVRIIKPA